MIQRVLTEVIAKPFLRGLLFPYFLFLFMVSAADASTNWEATRRQIFSLPPADKACLFVGMIAVWCLVAGRALRPVWQDKTIPLLIRQPIGPWELSVRLLPSLATALLPVVSIWWLASYGANPFTHYLGFVGLALPIILGASFGGLRLVVIGIAALGLLTWAYSYTPAAAYLGILVTPLLFRNAAAHIRSTLTVQRKAAHREISSASVIWVLVRRDWRSIVRTRRQALIELIAINLSVTLMMLALRINSQDSGRDMLLSACVLFLIGSLPAYRNLEVAKARLGRHLIRPEWPVSLLERALSLVGLAALLGATSALPIALAASRMGIYNLLVFAVFVIATVVFTAALFAKTLVRDSSSVGLYLNLILFHGVLISLLTSSQYLLLATLSIAASFRCMMLGLKHFAEDQH